MNIRKKNKNMLDKYWEEQLNIDYNSEYKHYQKLCVYKKNKEVISYNSWKEKIKKQIQNLNLHGLNEYSRYLEQKKRTYENEYALTQTLLVPFMIFFIGVIVVNCLELIFGNILIQHKLTLVYRIISYMFLTLYVFIIIICTKRDSPYKFFYQDMKEIVYERIEEQRKEKRERE